MSERPLQGPVGRAAIAGMCMTKEKGRTARKTRRRERWWQGTGSILNPKPATPAVMLGTLRSRGENTNLPVLAAKQRIQSSLVAAPEEDAILSLLS